MPRSIDAEKWNAYVDGRIRGELFTPAIKRLGISAKAGKMFDAGDPRSSGIEVWLKRCKGKHPWNGAQFAIPEYGRPGRPSRNSPHLSRAQGRVVLKPRNEQAELSLKDFELFRRRYLGHVSLPWHIDVAHHILEARAKARDSGERKFLLLNGPPGPGKSTALRDAGMWATVIDRSIRGANVSMAESLSAKTTGLMKREFERTAPAAAKERDLRWGTAVDAVATLAADFGPFQPEGRIDVWTRDAFTVLQADGVATAEKEPTWSSFGLDSAILGNRFDLMLCDDMIDKKWIRTDDARARAVAIFGDEVETRLDAGGLLVLAGQRLHPEDLYAWARDIEADDFDVWGDVEEVNLDQPSRKYFHLTYKAHDDERCNAREDATVHHRNAAPWPEGCLLDPLRVPWSVLSKMRTQYPERYFTVYQQEDYFDDSTLLTEAQLEEAWDPARKLWDRPDGLVNPTCLITVDPSGTNYWAIQAWVYERDGDDGLGGRRYLLDLRNERGMEAGDLLDRSYESGEFFGVLEQFRRNYVDIGLHLSHVIIESNAAQRYLNQYNHVKRWNEVNSVETISHQTGVRKLSETDGVRTLCKAQWKNGRLRLPGGDTASRQQVAPLYKQAMRWPIEPNDQVMAHWFMEVNLPKLIPVDHRGNSHQWRPSWMNQLVGV